MTVDGKYRAAGDLDRFVAQREYQRWLQGPKADLSVDALSFDEVGLWLELLPDGHAEWARSASPKPVFSPWTVDLEPSEAAVVVHASDAESARRALAEWLAVHPQFEVRPETSVVKAAASFQLRNGTVVSGGVQLRSQLLKRRSK